MLCTILCMRLCVYFRKRIVVNTKTCHVLHVKCAVSVDNAAGILFHFFTIIHVKMAGNWCPALTSVPCCLHADIGACWLFIEFLPLFRNFTISSTKFFSHLICGYSQLIIVKHFADKLLVILLCNVRIASAFLLQITDYESSMAKWWRVRLSHTLIYFALGAKISQCVANRHMVIHKLSSGDFTYFALLVLITFIGVLSVSERRWCMRGLWDDDSVHRGLDRPEGVCWGDWETDEENLQLLACFHEVAGQTN